jgi:MFS family permease
VETATQLRHNRDFVLIWFGQLTSEFGTGLTKLAVLLFVYASTHSTAATTAAFIAETAPWALLSPWSGALADRVDRRTLLIGSDLLRAVLLLPLLFDTDLPVLLAVLTAQAAVGTVFRPAYTAFLPAVVPAGQLAAANGFSSSSGSVLSLAAPAIGAVLFAHFGFTLIVLIDAATYLVSVLTLVLLRVRPAPLPEHSGATVREDLAIALGAIRRTPALRLLFAVMLCFGLMESLLSPLFVPFLQGTLHATATQIGFAGSAQAFGSIAGGVLVMVIARRVGPTRMLVVGSMGAALTIGAFGLSPTFLFAAVSLGASGLPGMLCQVGATTLLQTEVPDALRGRVTGGFHSMFGFITLLAAAVPAFVSGLIGVRAVVLLGSAFGFAAAAMALSAYRGLLPEDRAPHVTASVA